MFPIMAQVGGTSWKTKLMTKKGGDYFVAFRAEVRKKEKISIGSRIVVSFKLN